MKHISRKLSLELASLALAVPIIMIVALVWRLSSGPTQINFLKPFIEAGFYTETGNHLSIDRLTIGADDWSAPIKIVAEDVTVTQDDNAPLANIRTVSATISRHRLFTGQIDPVVVDIDYPAIFLPQKTDPAAQSPAPSEDFKDKKSDDLLSQLAHPKDGSNFVHWEKITIEDGSISTSQSSDGKLLAASINASLQRTAVGLKGELHGVSHQNAKPGEIIGAIEVNRGQKGGISLQTGKFMLSDLAALPQLSFLQNNTTVAEATITANLTDTKISDARVDLDVGGPQIKAEAHLEKDGENAKDKVTIDSTVQVTGLPIDRFAEFWPPEVSKGGRKWVLGNLSQGSVQSATAHIVAIAPRDDLSQMDVSSLDGTMQVSGVTVQYFGELPKVKNTSADISYDLKSMTITMTGGMAEGISLTGGTIVLDGFDQPEQSIKIDILLSGPIANALDLVDHQPLNYAKKLGLKSGEFGGNADTKLQMAFPLIESVSVDQLNVVTQSNLHDVSLPNAVGHLDMKALNGSLYVGMGGMEMIGTGVLADIPVTLDYRQSFEKNGPIIALFSGVVDDRQRGELGMDFPDRLKGPIGVSGTYNTEGATGTVDTVLDLTPATFAIDEIGYVKPPGKPGAAKFLVNLKNGKLRAIDPLSVTAPQFAVDGSAKFDPDTNKLTALTLTSLKADDTNMKVTVTPIDEGGTKIDVVGSEFDARRFLHKRHEKEPDQPDQNPSLTEVNVDLATIKTSDTNGLTGVKGQIVLQGRKWRHIDFKAMANGVPVFLTYLPDSTLEYPSYSLNAGTQDAGAAIAGFGLTNSVKGGALVIKGTRAAPSEDQPNPPLAGKIALTDFHLANLPIAARLFNLFSVTGFHKAISSADIHFYSFKTSFEMDKDEIRLADGRLKGDAIGLTIAGTVNRDDDTLNLYGTVVPAYGANSILNSIPLLGPLLTGGEGQGLFAATYSIKGPVENTAISMNPLSVFTPGVLRDILFGTSDPDMDSQ